MGKKLRTGCAYHGNRMLSHAITDMKEIAMADMDIVVHMLSHTDWERHADVMEDIFKASEAEGLEVWVDNWGIGGQPGDKSYFLGFHPEAHSYYGDGIMHGFQICLNSPAYRQFVKDWVDEVARIGGKTVFWDEPHIPAMKVPGTNDYYSACTCPTCRKMFEERFNKPMPIIMDADVRTFRNEVLVEFHDFISTYAASVGLKNVICFMPFQFTMDFSADPMRGGLDIDTICSMKNIESIGTDPYWFSKEPGHEYEYVYNVSKACVATANKHGKEHNMWIQGYYAPRGREEEIITATEAAYDGGARTILSWGFHGCESNSYRSKNPARSWLCTVEGMKRIKSMERDRILAENRKKYMK